MRDDLKLPWPWVAMELITWFHTRWYEILHGVELTVDLTPEQSSPPAPEVDFRFQTRPGETVDEAAKRLATEIDPILKRFRAEKSAFATPQRLPSIAKDPFDSPAADHARWFYAARVQGESIRSLALLYARDRSTIRYGIRQAEAILGLTRWEWK